jgi:hypothetical protein
VCAGSFTALNDYRTFTFINTARVTLDVNRLEISQLKPRIRNLAKLFVHRIIASIFLKEPSRYKKGTLIEVHHIAPIRDKSHNDPRYLQWLSQAENINENFKQTIFPDVD